MRLAGSALLLVTMAAALPVAADAPAPIVVVIESADSRVRTDRIRRRLTRELGIPTVALGDADAREARGTLTIAVEESGRRAFVYYLPHEGSDAGVQLVVVPGPNFDAGGDWLVEHAVAVVRTSIQRTLAMALSDDVIDPWVAERIDRVVAYRGPMSFSLPSEVIDPFEGTPPPPASTGRPYELDSEVLDPWERAIRERADGLSAPRPRTEDSE